MAEVDPMLAKPPQSERVSVVMPVHNALPYLDEAVRSILRQTFRDFEFVILDDASTDGSIDRLRKWAAQDARIRLHVGQRNAGPAASSNRVVEEASGTLIARMDADDVAHPDRLRRQVDLLARRPDIGLVGTLCNIIDGNGRRVRGPDFWRLQRRSWFAPFPHGSIMYRRELFEAVGGYREECVYWEDHDLLLRLSALARVATIPHPLYEHRNSRISTRLVSDQERVERSVDLMYRCMERLDEGRGYDDLLLPTRTIAREHRVDPRVFISLGSLELWGGGKPKLFRRLLRHGKLGANFRTLSALVWTSWASANAATLRLFMRALAELRNSLSPAVKDDAAAVLWLSPRPVPAVSVRRLPAAKAGRRSRVR